MRRTEKNIGGYRGRRSPREILKRVAWLLGILLLLVLLALIAGQRYIVYTDNGIRLELPFLSEPEKKPAPPADPDGLILQEEPKEPEKPEEPPEEPEERCSALELPLETLLDGSAAGKLEAAGAGVLVVTMKAPDGGLNWVSGEELARDGKVNSSLEDINEQLRAWNAGGVYTVARVHCFADDSVPYYRMSAGLSSGRGNWRDIKGSRWLNPLSPAAQDYVVGLCGELAGLGFDEILLEEAACPTEGRLEQIRWSSEDPEEELSGEEGFLARAAAALRPSGAVLSVRTSAGALSGQTGDGGLNADAVFRYAGRIWIPAGEAAAAEQMLPAGREIRLTEIVEELSEDPAWDQAQLLNT